VPRTASAKHDGCDRFCLDVKPDLVFCFVNF
jgi:hypothetical protein